MSGRAKRNQSPSKPNTLRVEPLEDRDLLSALTPLAAKPGTLYAGDYAAIDPRAPSHPVQPPLYRDGQGHSDTTDSTPGHSDTTPDSNEYVAGYPASTSNQGSRQQYSQSQADRPNNTLLATAGRLTQAGTLDTNLSTIGQPAVERQTGLNGQNLPGGHEDSLPRSAGPGLPAAELALGRGSQVSGGHLRGQPLAGLLLPGVSVRDVASLDNALVPDQDQADIKSVRVQEKVASAAVTNSVIAGIVPIDLAAIERGVDQFFARVESLGAELISAQASAKLAPWLFGAGLTTAAWQLAQWRLTKQPPQTLFSERDWKNRRLAWLLGLAVLPPGEMP